MLEGNLSSIIELDSRESSEQQYEYEETNNPGSNYFAHQIGTKHNHEKVSDTLEIGENLVNVKKKDDELSQHNFTFQNMVEFFTTASLYADTYTDSEKKSPLNHQYGLRAIKYFEGESSSEFEQRNDLRSDVPSISSGISDKNSRNISDNKGTSLAILLENFTLAKTEKFLSVYSAWLLQDVLVQGQLFLTSSNLYFLAHLLKPSGSVDFSGNLSLRSTFWRYTRYWCIIKDDTLFMYNSPTDIYFPVIVVELKDVKSMVMESDAKCATDGSDKLILTTKSREYRLLADSSCSANTWFNALKKFQFASQNKGISKIKLQIPINRLSDVDSHKIMKQLFGLKIIMKPAKEVSKAEEYVFCFFNEEGPRLKNELFKIRAKSSKRVTLDPKRHVPSNNVENSNALINSKLEDNLFTTSNVQVLNSYQPNEWKGWIMNGCCDDQIGKMSVGIKTKHKQTTIEYYQKDYKRHCKCSVCGNRIEPLQTDFKEAPDFENMIINVSAWTTTPLKGIYNMWNARPIHYKCGDSFFSDDDPLLTSDEGANSRFIAHFKSKDKSLLIATYFAYLNKHFPIYGKVYISNASVCFKSLVPGYSMKMVLPLENIENCSDETGYNLVFYGIVLSTFGQQDKLYLEFSSENARTDFVSVLRRCINLNSNTNGAQKPMDNYLMKTKLNDGKLKCFEDKINSEGYNLPLLIDINPYYTTEFKPVKNYTIGLLTIGSRGDVQPYLALAKGLKAEGHKVIIITHEEFHEFVNEYGIEFQCIAGNPTQLMSLMVQHEQMNVGMFREASIKFKGWIDDLLETTWNSCKSLNLDILIESPSAIAGIHIAEALQIPYFRAFSMPWTRSRAYPHAFIFPDQKRGGSYNYLTHTLFENIFWKGISTQVNNWRCNCLKLKKTTLAGMKQDKVPFLYNISRIVFPPAIDFSDWVKVTGYWFLENDPSYVPQEKVKNFIASAKSMHKKLIYIGFGSIVVNDSKKVTRSIVEAVKESNVFCILNKGWSERLGSETTAEDDCVTLPDSILCIDSVSHDWLLPQMDAAIHHGGAGTTGAVLKAGIPCAIKPFFGDQFFYASRIEEMGIGKHLRRLDKGLLVKMIGTITTDKSMIQKARAISKQIHNENGVKTAINCIYSELEYARNFIESKINIDDS